MIKIAIGVLPRAGEFLLGKRPSDKPYPSCWEFPGGKLEEGESARDALVREWEEELGVTVTPQRFLDTLNVPEAHCTADVFMVRFAEQRPFVQSYHTQLMWASRDLLSRASFKLTPATKMIVDGAFLL